MVVGSCLHRVVLRGDVDSEGRKVRGWWGWAICPAGGAPPAAMVAIPLLDKGTPEVLLARGITRGESPLGRRAWDTEVESWLAAAAVVESGSGGRVSCRCSSAVKHCTRPSHNEKASVINSFYRYLIQTTIVHGWNFSLSDLYSKPLRP